MTPFLDSTDLLDQSAELRERLRRDGYLYLHGVVPGVVLDNLRLRFLALARSAGWVRADRPLEDGIADLNGFCVEPEPGYMDVYHQMYRVREFHDLQHHPGLIGLLERLLEGTVLPHPRIIARFLFPNREEFTTPAHQDYIPVQGTTETYTAWIPLSDLPSEMGGLQVASGSHRHGVFEFRPALGAGGLEVLDPLEGTWVGSAFQAGDVLIFHSLCVHKGVPNRSDRLRLSVDARFQRVDLPIEANSLEPHGKQITWEDVYADWPEADDLKYYWRRHHLTLKAYDFSYHVMRDRVAFEMAEAGDERARSALQRIVSRDDDPARRRRAAELLARLDRDSVEVSS